MIIRRVDPKHGYDVWAETYDTTPNPVVWMDEHITPGVIGPCAGERILDAGCGTGRNIARLLAGGARVTGMDFSEGMLRVARERFPDVPLMIGDLQARWPFDDGAFDAVLCALVGEHLSTDPGAAARRDVVEYYLGDTTPGAATERFLRACADAIDLRDRTWAEQQRRGATGP